MHSKPLFPIPRNPPQVLADLALSKEDARELAVNRTAPGARGGKDRRNLYLVWALCAGAHSHVVTAPPPCSIQRRPVRATSAAGMGCVCPVYKCPIKMIAVF